MLLVDLKFVGTDWPIIRQTPSKSGVFRNIQFQVNKPQNFGADYFVVYEDLKQAEVTNCPRDRRILFTAEPPGIKKYNKDYLDQFGTIVACDPELPHENLVFNHQALPWMVGMKYDREQNSWASEYNQDYDQLKSESFPKKEKLLSFMCSKKESTTGHRLRHEFVQSILASELDVDVYGIGYKDLPDKWDAIGPYKYHLVIENSSIPYYWTEKLADAYCGGAYPIYWGCTNIEDYFPEGSFTKIDIYKPEDAIAKIKEIVNSDIADKASPLLEKAKDKILDEYNLFAEISKLLSAPFEVKGGQYEIRPEHTFTSESNKSPGFFSKVKRKLFGGKR